MDYKWKITEKTVEIYSNHGTKHITELELRQLQTKLLRNDFLLSSDYALLEQLISNFIIMVNKNSEKNYE